MLADGVPSNIVDPAVTRAKTGVELQYISDKEVKKAILAVPEEEGKVLGAQWAAQATEIKDIFREGETDPKWFAYHARLYLGMKRLMEKHSCHAWSGCHNTGHLWDPEFTAPPCFAFVKLKDEGYPCGCEADQGALLAMIMLMYLAEAPADMGNCVIPTYTDDHMEDWQMPTPGPNIVIISHSVTPLKMDGFDKPAAPYAICGTHCSTCNAINNTVELRKGQPVTIARLGPGARTMFIARGTIDASYMTPVEGNRNAAYIRVRDRDDFYEKQSLVGNHLTYVYGDVVDDLAGLCKELGIEPVIA
jgi:L-fucose isomerase-like protein